MTHLQFRIVLMPQDDEEPDNNQLRRYVENCELVVDAMQRVELEKEEPPCYPEILEYIVDVQAQDQNIISNRNKIEVYASFIMKWYDITVNLDGARPLLQLYLNESFVRKRTSVHGKIMLRNISFGVHARFGEYKMYSRLGHGSYANFLHDLKELEIIVSVENTYDVFCNTIRTKSMVVSYSHIRNIIVSLCKDEFDMYLDLLHPPLFYIETKVSDDMLSILNKRSHSRVLPFDIDRTVVGKSNILRLSFSYASKGYEILSCLRNRCDNIPVNFVAMRSVFQLPPTIPNIDLPHFGCAYMWAAITRRSFTIIEQTSDMTAALRKIRGYCLEDGDCLETVLTSLLFIIDSGRFLNYWNTIDILYASHLANRRSEFFKDYTVPSKCRLIRRVTITPTRVLLWPADLMCENRILRNFDSDFYLRVTFRDDDFFTMNFRIYDESVFHEVVTLPMNNGFRIGNRHYQMLAWSSAQLKEHGVSMYATDSAGKTASDIRNWTEIDPRTNMNIPKCLARIGQCFSQTEDSVRVPLDNIHVKFEEDIEGGLNATTLKPYIFSDGIGKISSDLAKRVKATFRHGRECSALQIRYGGCKGMLVTDPTLTGTDIVFRESMRKFNCRGYSHTKLEIAKKSGPIPMRLNRPLVAILHDLGVDPRVFLRLQEIMLQNLTDMLWDEEKAAEYLNARTPFSVFKFKDLSKSGLGLTVEPFFRSLLLALHRYYIDLIKTKANIEIDPAFARNMFGVLDETGLLQYGQVFVQYSRDGSLGETTPKDTKILKGIVMVTKFPCVHPGDVRKFEAVDVPELHHIVDCIVFPRKGPRPHPDEMAGSDLDGDEYAVIWMDELIFKKKNDTPADYPKMETNQFQNVTDFLSHSRPEEITRFLVSYIQNDNIGSISSSHLAFADQLSIYDNICLRIAKKHAVAVDFAKTGYSAILQRDERPRKYPDFMEKFWQRKYNSKKSLGKMYRVSKDFENDNQSAKLQYCDVQMDPALVVEGWQKFEESAVLSRNEYNNTIKTVLQTYGIGHETEAYGGAFIKLHHRFLERRDRAEIVNLVHTWLKELVEKTREQFFEGISDPSDVKEIVSDAYQKASAWYIVTYRERSPEFLSFPWVISDMLANIRILKSDRIHSDLKSRCPLVETLENQILKMDENSMLPRLSPDATFTLRSVIFLCDRRLVERAIAILTKWGDDEKIISSTHAEGKFLYYKTFIKLIIFVAGLEGYVSSKNEVEHSNLSSAGLCLSFFKYCMKLRFLSKQEVQNVLPFPVYNDRILAKRAIVTYHSIAVTGIFPALCCQEFMDNAPESVAMKPVPIDSSIFGRSPIEESKLWAAQSALLSFSEVEQIAMREHCQRKKVIVDAYGTINTLQRLKSLLRKNPGYLKQFFETGQIP